MLYAALEMFPLSTTDLYQKSETAQKCRITNNAIGKPVFSGTENTFPLFYKPGSIYFIVLELLQLFSETSKNSEANVDTQSEYWYTEPIHPHK
jgi:hypothetical protein